jgi:hypothetical protein
MKCCLFITLKEEYVVFENKVLKKYLYLRGEVRNLGLTHTEELC